MSKNLPSPNAEDATIFDPVISIVLPAHNEVRLLGATITNLVTGLTKRKLSYEILIVENGSTDGTLRLARMLSLQLANVRVLSLPRSNYGAALRSGFEAARGVIVTNFDVDYYDLDFLDLSIQAIADGHDLVLASKRVKGAHDHRSLGRRLLTAGFARTLHTLLQFEVSDAHGMKAMKRAVFVPIVASCTVTGSVFDVEMVLRASREGRSIAEIPAEVTELRPPRTSVLYRSVETLVGVFRLRATLGATKPSSRV